MSCWSLNESIRGETLLHSSISLIFSSAHYPVIYRSEPGLYLDIDSPTVPPKGIVTKFSLNQMNKPWVILPYPEWKSLSQTGNITRTSSSVFYLQKMSPFSLQEVHSRNSFVLFLSLSFNLRCLVKLYSRKENIAQWMQKKEEHTQTLDGCIREIVSSFSLSAFPQCLPLANQSLVSW